MRLVSIGLVLVASATLGCGSGGGSGDDDDGSGTADAGPLPDAAYGDSYSVTWGPLTVEPLQEDTRCVVKRLGNDQAIKVGQIHNVLGDASHHLIVYRLAEGTDPEMAEPYACAPFQDVLDPTKGAPLGVTQIEDELISLPPGVAFSLEANQLVRLEMHFINAGSEPIEVQATTTFVEIPDADFRDEADFLFVGNPDIEIQPHASLTVGPSFMPVPPELVGINVFALTGHQHQFGTGVEVATTPGPDGPDTMVYQPENFSWDEPPTVYHRPPFTMPAGGGFRFTCEFMNTSDQVIGFGEDAGDEMCFFWAYYYPSVGAKVCVHTEQYGGIDGCCPGNALCSLLDQL